MESRFEIKFGDFVLSYSRDDDEQLPECYMTHIDSKANSKSVYKIGTFEANQICRLLNAFTADTFQSEFSEVGENK